MLPYVVERILASRWKDAVKYGAVVWEIQRHYYSELDPYLLIFEYNYAKTLANAERRKDAADILKRIAPQLRPYFRYNPALSQQLAMLVERCAKSND